MKENKNKVMQCTRRVNVVLNGEPLGEAECFRYLVSKITVVGGIETSEV